MLAIGSFAPLHLPEFDSQPSAIATLLPGQLKSLWFTSPSLQIFTGGDQTFPTHQQARVPTARSQLLITTQALP